MSSSHRSRMVSSLASVMYTNAVYFPNSSIYRGHTPATLNYSCINRVYYAFASVAPDGGVFAHKLNDEWADVKAPVDGAQGGLGSLRHLKKKHPHLHVVLSIGGDAAAEAYPVVAANATFRNHFARTALSLIEACGLDGIDLVWKYPKDAKQGQDFLALLAAVRACLTEDRFIVTAALPASPSILQFIDLEAAARHLDHVNLIAYDLCGYWSRQTGHHAQLYAMSKEDVSGSAGVRFMISRGLPAKKILLGIPTHGRSFLSAAGPGQSFRGGGGDAGAFAYNQLPRPGSKEVVDKRYVAAQCLGGDGGFVTYDNADTVKTKAEFAKQKGLAGLYYGDVTADSTEKSRSLVAAGFRALHTS